MIPWRDNTWINPDHIRAVQFFTYERVLIEWSDGTIREYQGARLITDLRTHFDIPEVES